MSIMIRFKFTRPASRFHRLLHTIRIAATVKIFERTTHNDEFTRSAAVGVERLVNSLHFIIEQAINIFFVAHHMACDTLLELSMSVR